MRHSDNGKDKLLPCLAEESFNYAVGGFAWVELQLAAQDRQHQLVLGGGRDTLPSLSVSRQSLLWIGSHSGQWGSRYLQSNQAGFQNVGQQTVGKLLILADFCAACHTAQGVGCEWSIRNAVHVVCGPCMLTRPSKKRGEAWGSPLQCISYDSSSSLNMNCCSHSPWQNVFVFPRNSF